MAVLWKRIIQVSVLALLLAGVAVADDVTDTIDEAVAAYKNGEFGKAAEDLTYALDLVKQKKGDSLKAYLPEPLSGWTAEEAKSQTAGAAMFGGGTMINRTYRKGDASVTIDIMTDSPLMQAMTAMISNPMLASSDGGEMMRINREKAIVKYNKADKSGEVMLLIDKRFMITVKGNEVAKEDLIEYAKAIDVNKLKNIK